MAKIITHKEIDKEIDKELIYHKIIYSDKIYYILDSVYPTIKKYVGDLYNNVYTLPYLESDLYLFRYSDYVVNIKTNKIIKCRISIDEIIDGYLISK